MMDWDSLVEARLDAIRVDNARKEIRIDLTCPWEGNKPIQIVGIGVDDFCATGMRLSNIVDRVTQYGSEDVKHHSLEVARRLFVLMRGDDPTPSDLEWPSLRERLTAIESGALVLLEMEPVYGVTVLILAEAFSILSSS